MAVNVPVTQRALIVQGAGQYVFSPSTPTPLLEPMAILVKVQATALNPVDAKMVDLHGPSLDGCVGGYDFAGYIVAIGSKAQTQEPPHDTPLQVGSRVAGIVLGGNPLRPRVGAFCEYVLADPKFVLIIPDVISFEEGASLGLPVATAGMALYQSLGLKLPAENGSPPDTRAETEEQINDEWALVLGGSSATGTMAIQMLKLSGYKVITTASPKNFTLVSSYGADSLVDYHSPTCASDIRSRTNNSLSIALDCISEGESMKTCYEAIGAGGGKYTALNPFPMPFHTRNDVKPHWIFILTMFGQPINVKGPFKRPRPRQKDVEFEAEWFKRAQRLLDQGLIRTHPVRVMKGGIEKVTEGINEVRLGRVSGEKLVYRT